MVAAWVVLCHVVGAAQERTPLPAADLTRGSLAEVSGKRRILLLVARATALDARDPQRPIIERALRADPQENRRHRLAFNELAAKLNKYIRKYQSIGATDRLAEADFIIFFNLLEYRRILYRPYPYGELYVIAKGAPGGQTPPHVVWKSKKVQHATDAIGDLIKELRTARGER